MHAKKFELVSDADDLYTSFGIDRHYNFELIEVVCQYLEKVINKH